MGDSEPTTPGGFRLPPPRPPPVNPPEPARREEGAPLAGGLDNGTPWCGGTRMLPNFVKRPKDILCFRPTDFKAKQRQHDDLKKGLDLSKRLELKSAENKSTNLTGWIQQVRRMVEKRGFDPVFRVRNPGNNPPEIYLMDNWGLVTPTLMKNHIEYLKNEESPEADEFDRENLHLSADMMLSCLGEHLSLRVASLANADTTGPEYFYLAVQQVSYLTQAQIRQLSNQLGAMNLRTVDGENVPKLTEAVTEVAREIEGSGQPPADLKHLVATPYTTGSDEAFRLHALNAYNQVLAGKYLGTWELLVQEHNNFYQDLLQNGQYTPAKAKKDQDESIHAMIAKAVDDKIGNLKLNAERIKTGDGGNGGKRRCFNCGSTEHILRNCPQRRRGNQGDWKARPPGRNDPREKTEDGVIYKWCGRCNDGKGQWTTGTSAHVTSAHNPEVQTEPKDVGKANLAADDKANLTTFVEDNESNDFTTSGPLEFGFVCATMMETSAKISRSLNF